MASPSDPVPMAKRERAEDVAITTDGTDKVVAEVDQQQLEKPGNPDPAEHPAKKAKGNGHDRENGGGTDSRRSLGRGEYFRLNVDKRDRTQQNRDVGPSKSSVSFSTEEISAEERRPKRKVAVLIGYSGTGYKGMQIMPDQETIEGDLFKAFVAAGAISKANANDPKKSGLVRCARTDKGVHAAGNVISLKLIIEDEDIVQKINDNLPSQIRVWGIHRTLGSFSCYKACDSRWYEYLLPSHCLLPPHPRSYLGSNILALAEEVGDLEGYKARQADVLAFWEDFEREHVNPVLDSLDEPVRELVSAALLNDAEGDEEKPQPSETSGRGETDKKPVPPTVQRAAADAIRQIKKAIYKVKSAYRVPESRRQKLADALAQYEGTHNFHNYTIHKRFTDSSAKRHIKSFKVMAEPVLVNGTEWLSLKVHGQSFMMHQIRKMVSMATLVVRCGTDVRRIPESFGPTPISIPKAPGLGLLLERPVFDSYNDKVGERDDRDQLDFDKYGTELLEFKQREIYDRIFREDADELQFFRFFAHVDGYRDPYFMYLSSKGLAAVAKDRERPTSNKDVPRGKRAKPGRGGAAARGGEGDKVKLAMESDDEEVDGPEEG